MSASLHCYSQGGASTDYFCNPRSDFWVYQKAPNCIFILAVGLPALSFTSVSYILKLFSKMHKVQRIVSVG